jgi:NADPH2:quinone reductase
VRSVRYHAHGGPEVLQIDEVPTPAPQNGQVLIEVEAVGANVIDTVFRAGTGPWRRPLPGTLTGDVVGRVAALGPGVPGPGIPGVAVGDRVAALSEDAFADYVTADAHWVVPVPEGADAGEATILSMTAPLALRLLRAGRLGKSDTVLVQAAAGGIGHLALQLAKILGTKTVIGAASSPEKLDFVRSYGADEAIDSSDPAWPEHVRAAASGGVDVVLDAVGGDVFNQGLELLAPLGRMVTYGAASGTLPTLQALNLAALKSVTGVSMFAWRAARPDEARADMNEVAGYWNAGRLRTAIHARFPLQDTASVHEILQNRENLGRLVTTI